MVLRLTGAGLSETDGSEVAEGRTEGRKEEGWMGGWERGREG